MSHRIPVNDIERARMRRVVRREGSKLPMEFWEWVADMIGFLNRSVPRMGVDGGTRHRARTELFAVAGTVPATRRVVNATK